MEDKSKARIAKNTGVLYLRMFITMFITLYTVRVLLRALGVDDFGLYNLVGGVVAIFSALRNLFASSTQRFLNYEMGRDNIQRLRQIFSMSINIQAIICIVFFVIVEITGIWLIGNKLSISADRLSAAYFILHFSVLTALVSIMTTPFDAVIIANEKIKIFSIFSVVETILRLLITYVVLFNSDGSIDNLKLYAVLYFSIALIVRFMNSFYCRKHFPECKYFFFWDKNMFRQLGTFSGWNFIGSLTYSLANEGINVLLNIFGGIVFNAARAVVLQVQSAIVNFVRNVFMASNPQITKLYAQDKKDSYFNLIFLAGKFSFFIFLIVSIPVFFYIDSLLKFWLNEVPTYSGIFCRLVLLFWLFRVLHDTMDSLYKASGKLKLYMIIDSVFLVLMLLLSFSLLKLGFPIETPFVVMIIIEIINNIVILFLAKKTESLSISLYLKKMLFPCFRVAMISIIISYLLFRFVQCDDILTLFILLFASALMVVSVVFVVGISNSEKQMIKDLVFKRK